MFANPSADEIARVLRAAHTVAIVGPSPDRIVAECIRLKMPALWLQDGVIDVAAAERAQQAGIFTVMDRCLFRDRAGLVHGTNHLR